MKPHINPLSKQLLTDFQSNMPICATPYQLMAEQLGCSEEQVLENLRSLKDQNVLSRVGPVFAHQHAGASTLAALAVDEARLEQVALYISKLPAVNHNYRREHAYNLWFVLTGPDQEYVTQQLEHIHQATGLKPLDLPMLHAYRIDLGFPLEFEL